MKRNLLIAAVLLLSSLSSFADHLSERLMFAARLSGTNNTTVLKADANGIATLFLNKNRDSLFVNVATGNMGGSLKGAHIHMGAPGTDGPVVVNLSDFIQQNVIRTVITGATLSSIFPALFDESLYVNVHAEDPIATGTARGQIKLERDFGFYTNLDTEQEVPAPMGSTAIGSGNFVIDQNDDSMRVAVITSNLSGDIQGAHLHMGLAGQAGGVIVNVSDLIKDGTRLVGKIAVPDSLKGGKLKGYINAGMVYLNIHTTANPAGEIRGQALVSSDLYIDGIATPVAGVTVDAQAAGHGYINKDFQSFRYFFVYEQENLNAGTAIATFVRAGEIVKTLNAADGKIAGSWTAADATQPLTEELMRAFLYGEISIRISTVLNPAGEIEGTLTRALREGYAYELDAQQEIPAPTVTKTPLGGGMVSVDSRRTNAHIMLAYDSLSGDPIGGHMHLGVPGETGGVLFALPLMNGGAFTYWTASSGFSKQTELRFRRDSIYVNIHTAANMAGEIRGNVTRNYKISSETTTSITEAANIAVEYTVSPNPFNNEIRLKLNAEKALDIELNIMDMNGRSLYREVLEAGSNSLERSVNTSNLESGIYFMTLSANGQRISTEKLVK